MVRDFEESDKMSLIPDRSLRLAAARPSAKTQAKADLLVNA